MKRNLNKFLVLVVAVILPFLFALPAQAADFDFKISTAYELSGDLSAKARTIIEVTNNVSTPSLSSMVIPVAGPASNIAAAYQDGGKIPSSFNAGENTIRLDTTKDQSGLNKKWSVVINYEVEVAKAFGDTQIVSITPLDYKTMKVASETVSITADLQLGIAVARGPDPDSSKISVGKQILTWQNKKGPLAEAVGVLFGDGAVAEVRLVSDLKNDTWWWQTKTITLPPDTNQQRVFLDSIEPAPTNVRLDVDGNILAEYRLRPQASVQVTAVAKVAVNNFNYALDSQQIISETPPAVSGRYTANFAPWLDSEIESENDPSQPAGDKIGEIFKASKELEVEAEDAYQASRQLADKLIGELRASSIPARLVLGQVFGDGGAVFDEAQPHAWVEAYVAGVGWMTLDPAFEKKGNYFGATDVLHVGLVLRGITPDFPPDQLGETQVTYTENDIPETPEMKPVLKATKFVLLPGIAVQSISVEMPPGVIVDNTAITVGDGSPRQLGSLAPLQNAQVRLFGFGLSAFSSQPVKYGDLGGEENLATVLVETTMKVNYIFMIILLTLILVVIVGSILWHRRSPKRERVKRSKDAVVFATEDNGDNIEAVDLIPPPPPTGEPPTEPEKTETPSGDTISSNELTPSRPSELHRRPYRRRIQ